MKFRWQYAALIVCVAVVVEPLWRYNIGVERVTSDIEESPVGWEWFVKHRKTWQYKFVNPANPSGIEAKMMNELTPDETARFKDFCEVRYGVSDTEQCYRAMCAGSVGATDGCWQWSAPPVRAADNAARDR
ncbi:hypothetical protein HY57_11430 [Dyella japonica A8]|uniref:Uncharacterized protein n=1 Tax=Dyella japonica A8 TaxID=1217721 RepID=A0A075K0Y9_9GAMM|nr:hypothetical protein HY57_11430 [Dyella japonica A8]